ncbi:transposase family protein [Streptomyces cadmiisoli]|uniref:H repeat-associated protein N-terminal domain-containing protein n=1 Tax=Streptomyces cadmiisoli TaxID=2184053 RepID=A0A2Z4JEL4_9ACTN|nr:hypothetical protein DN051_44405 [Streptomyces cadmiisoli]
MPAHQSSRMPSCLEQLGDASSLIALETVADLRTYLNDVSDPRRRRGIRPLWTALLTTVAAAVLAGATSMAAIGEWAEDAPQRVLSRLGFRCRRTELSGVRRHPPRPADRPHPPATPHDHPPRPGRGGR